MEAVWLPHPDVWGTKITCVLIALSQGLTNGPHNIEWATCAEFRRVTQFPGILPALCAFHMSGTGGASCYVTHSNAQGDMQFTACVDHPP